MILVAVFGTIFWGGLVFFSFRKALVDGKENAAVDFLKSLKEQFPQVFIVSSGVSGFLAIVFLVLFFIRSSGHAGVIGPSLMMAIFSGILTGASVACLLYMDD
jgi:hypothetical protein